MQIYVVAEKILEAPDYTKAFLADYFRYITCKGMFRYC